MALFPLPTGNHELVHDILLKPTLDPSLVNLALFKVQAAIIDRFFSTDAVYSDYKAIIGRGFDKGAMFSRFQYSRLLYFFMLPFLVHILFFEDDRLFCCKWYIKSRARIAEIRSLAGRRVRV
jgi:hypothetical protein